MERIKVRFFDPQFFVNEEKKTVACKLNGYVSLPENVHHHYWEEQFPIKTVGVAKCSEEDTFDVNAGKKIALSKAENKGFVKVNRLLNPLLIETERVSKLIREYRENSAGYARRNKEYIDKIGSGLLPEQPEMNKGAVTHNGHAYVDLGLPSGTLWATMNVGAETETDYGLYFAWGETTGYSGITTDKQFSWSDYKYGDASTSESGLTKYNAADRLTTLEASDDAVTVNWGGDWHMPDRRQIAELLDTANCTSVWVTNYNGSGVNGRLFTSVRNGKRLFVPAAGACLKGSQGSVGGHGDLWSRSLVSDLPQCAWRMSFGSDVIEQDYVIRFDGVSVRGVLNQDAFSSATKLQK